MQLGLILLTIIYMMLSHASSRYHRVFTNVCRLIDRNPKELALVLNPTLLSYLGFFGRLLGFGLVVIAVLNAMWVIAGAVALYMVVGPLITEKIIPLPSQRWCLLRMKRELKKNIDRSNATDNTAEHARLFAIEMYFMQAVRKLVKPDIA